MSGEVEAEGIEFHIADVFEGWRRGCVVGNGGKEGRQGAVGVGKEVGLLGIFFLVAVLVEAYDFVDRVE